MKAFCCSPCSVASSPRCLLSVRRGWRPLRLFALPLPLADLEGRPELPRELGVARICVPCSRGMAFGRALPVLGSCMPRAASGGSLRAIPAPSLLQHCPAPVPAAPPALLLLSLQAVTHPRPHPAAGGTGQSPSCREQCWDGQGKLCAWQITRYKKGAAGGEADQSSAPVLPARPSARPGPRLMFAALDNPWALPACVCCSSSDCLGADTQITAALIRGLFFLLQFHIH